jgi:uncharacterized membrane protein (DUF441 family)
MTAVFARIILRYGAGYLAAKGLGDLSTDPDVATALTLGLGVAAAVVSEAWYVLAHKFGWAK